ncbi:MAG: guanylate kinase [Bacteroidetes bacterium]|jgi:guanylate kinase|nr:guanylate kinase [Bacteroidota bacterium]MBT3748653.1 guanylate kinase [Bacteroidota bacterium]MBT4401507.1 guanylate kinase [Bacteroidota bacterium]MBT4411153.1 guanylate kinase [Bacteroidota bacterium]MBT7093221.1 guanylate kinase [Bacteroidota bacterium]
MKHTGKLIVLSAPSGSGKTTIAKELLSAGLGLEFSISACSREKRTSETDGKDYFFLSPEEFQSRIESGDFLEWEEVYPKHFYGTLKSEVQRIWDEGKHVLFDIDVKGGRSIKQLYQTQTLAVFIQAPSIEVITERLNNRSTDSPEIIAMRINKAEEELGYAKYFDRIIINDQLDTAVRETIDYVRQFITN